MSKTKVQLTKPESIPLDDLKDVNINEPDLLPGQSVVYSGTEWVNGSPGFVENVVGNTFGLVVNNYHQEEGRNGYYHPNSGLSEGQFLLITGVAMAYRATQYQRLSWILNILLENLIPTLYRGKQPPPPAEITRDNLWIPHWIFNVKGDFVGHTCFYHENFIFQNGRAFIPVSKYGNKVRTVYRVVSIGSTFDWKNPYAVQLTGTDYPIVSFTKTSAGCEVLLTDNSFNGTLNIIYTAEVGTIIRKNQPYECWPFWRNLDLGEIDCALDSVHWAYYAYETCYEATLLPIFLDMKLSTLASAPIVYDLNVDRDWIKPIASPRLETLPYYLFLTRTGVVSGRTLTKDMFVRYEYVPSVPSSASHVDGGLAYSAGQVLATSGGSGTGLTVRVDSVGFSGNITAITMINPGAGYNDGEILTILRPGGGGSQATCKVNVTDGDIIIGRADLKEFIEPGETLTWTLKAKNTVTVKLFMDRLTLVGGEPDYTYDPLKRYEVAVTLPASGDDGPFQELNYNPSDFRNSLNEPYPISEKVLQLGVYIRQQEANEVTVRRVKKIGDSSKYPYVPGAIPFIANTIYNQLIEWRGTPYSGYQSPWIWNKIGDQDSLERCLDFVEDAQNDYFSKIGILGPFTPVYYWDRPDNTDYGPAGTWGWVAPDPNTTWGGFQYRTAQQLGMYLYDVPTNARAVDILNKFLTWANGAWTSPTLQPPPTTFPPDGPPNNFFPESSEPYFTSLIGEAAMFSGASGALPTTLTNQILTKCITYLETLYNETGPNRGSFIKEKVTRKYFAWQHAECMTFLSQLLLYYQDDLSVIGTSRDRLIVILDGNGDWLETNLR